VELDEWRVRYKNLETSKSDTSYWERKIADLD